MIPKPKQCRRGHPYDLFIYIRPSGYKDCRACERMRKDKWRVKQTNKARGLPKGYSTSAAKWEKAT